MLRRRFVDLPDRQAHVRSAGQGGAPLVMLHPSPGSSLQLAALITLIGDSRQVLAPDTPGYGDSPALALAAPTIADFARATLEVIDASGLSRFDLYGSHTGAAIAVEIALLAPDRVGKLVLDGMGLFSPEDQAEHLAHYAPVMTPDVNGAYLQTALMFLRDQYVYWPWYRKLKGNVHGGGLPAPRALHAWLVELLKGLETYHLGYRASFAYPAAERLPLVRRPTLALAHLGDPLLSHTRAAAGLLSDGRFESVVRDGETPLAATAAAITAFLDA